MSTEQFERLYEQHAQRLFGFLAYRTGDAALAEELVAHTFQRALAARRPLNRRRTGEKTWIYSVALACLRDASVSPARQSVMPALAALPDEDREALALRYGADLSLNDIAKVIGKPRSTVEGRIYRGLKCLRAELSGEDDQPADARAALG
jgi:DNA-directed RNA polymerase specialized sigma24 family protein